jgi:nucleoside-triphosphatase THEP1
MDMNVPPLWLLTGSSGSGKTTFCRELVQYAHSLGWDVAGLLSPAWMETGKKKGILIEDVRSGDQHKLAYTSPQSRGDLQLGPWYFDERVLACGNRVIEKSSLCDLLIVDELGPLEFNAGVGLTEAFDIIDARNYQVGLVVIRSTLLSQARKR